MWPGMWVSMTSPGFPPPAPRSWAGHTESPLAAEDGAQGRAGPSPSAPASPPDQSQASKQPRSDPGEEKLFIP